MTAHNGGVFLLDPGLGVFCCTSREKGLEHVVDCVCDGWDEVDFLERLVVRIFLVYSLVTSPICSWTRIFSILGICQYRNSCNFHIYTRSYVRYRRFCISRRLHMCIPHWLWIWLGCCKGICPGLHQSHPKAVCVWGTLTTSLISLYAGYIWHGDGAILVSMHSWGFL